MTSRTSQRTISGYLPYRMHRLACLFYDCKTIYYSNMTIIYFHSLKVLSSIYWQEDNRNRLKNSKSVCTYHISFTFCIISINHDRFYIAKFKHHNKFIQPTILLSNNGLYLRRQANYVNIIYLDIQYNILYIYKTERSVRIEVRKINKFHMSSFA